MIHPAAVQPGLTMDVVVTQEWTRHEPKTYERPTLGGPKETAYVQPPGNFTPFTTDRPALQVALGYGWRHSEDVGTYLHLAGGNLTPPTLGGYVQLLGSPVDAGLGVLLPFIGYVGGYGLVGKGIPLGLRSELRFDGGARALYDYAEETRAWGPMGLLSVRRGAFTVGVWGDATFHNRATFALYCDEICRPENFVRRRTAVGAYLRVGHAPSPTEPAATRGHGAYLLHSGARQKTNTEAQAQKL